MVMSPEEVEDNRHSDPPEVPEVECPCCDGTGRFPPRFTLTLTCPQCEGSGTVSAAEVEA